MAKPRSKKEMVEYLWKHETHNTFHESDTYSRNVKIHGIHWRTEEARQVMGVLVDSENRMEDFWLDIQQAFDEFHDENPGYYIIFEGRSAGHAALVGAPNGRRLAGYPAYLNSLDWKDLKDLFNAVWAFDSLMISLWEQFINYCYSHHIEEREEEVTRTVKYWEIVENADS